MNHMKGNYEPHGLDLCATCSECISLINGNYELHAEDACLELYRKLWQRADYFGHRLALLGLGNRIFGIICEWPPPPPLRGAGAFGILRANSPMVGGLKRMSRAPFPGQSGLN